MRCYHDSVRMGPTLFRLDSSIRTEGSVSREVARRLEKLEEKTLATTDKLIKENPKMVGGFVRATIKALDRTSSTATGTSLGSPTRSSA